MSEDFQMLFRKTRSCLEHIPMNLSTIEETNLLDIREIINVFTNEDMENTPPESWM